MNAAPLVRNHFERSAAAAEAFFGAHALEIAGTCRRMADRFDRGGTLFVFGSGAQATDAQHVAVEFVHPVIVGKRALPALALTSDTSVLSGALRSDPDAAFAAALDTLGGPADIAMGLCSGEPDARLDRALATARRRGMLTLLAAAGGAAASSADSEFHVPTADPLLAQEIHETLYHLLWELVHVFFESRSALNPFQLVEPSLEARLDAAIEDVRHSILRKAADVAELRRAMASTYGDRLGDAAVAMAARIRAGGKVLAFGNGGSATDAQDVAADCMLPDDARSPAVAALALPNDVAVVTAIANDVGVEHVFARQLEAFGRRGDVALGFSTSGTSRNVVRAFETAKRHGLLTIAFSGTGGGALAGAGAVDYCFTTAADYVPRIQETHATAWHALVRAMRAALVNPAASVAGAAAATRGAGA